MTSRLSYSTGPSGARWGPDMSWVTRMRPKVMPEVCAGPSEPARAPVVVDRARQLRRRGQMVCDHAGKQGDWTEVAALERLVLNRLAAMLNAQVAPVRVYRCEHGREHYHQTHVHPVVPTHSVALLAPRRAS